MNRTAARNNNERITNEETRRQMADNTEFGPRKTLIILAIVAGCFAVLWPKIFYPMLNGPVNNIPTPTDVPACCDLVFTNDVNTVDIMQEMCKNILRHHQVDPRVRDALKSSKLTPQSASFCRDEVLARCGIDLSSFLAEKERLGKTYKQVLEEIRTFNSSICLKRQFGVPLSQLGTPHLIRYHILMPHSPIRQERRTPPHAGGLHPAMRERGRAIPSSHIVPKVDGRPDHVVVQKMRPPLGASGRVVPAPSGSTGMGIIMPLYSLGIVLFFLYTIAKVMRKSSDNEIYAEYQNPAAEREFRNRVFSPDALSSAITGTPYYRKERPPSPVRPTPTIEELKEQAAGDIEIDQLRQRLVDTEAAMERIVVQMGSLSRTVVHSPSPQRDTQDECTSRSCCSRIHNGLDEHDGDTSSTVKVMGMEMTACCEGGQKISRPTTPIMPQAHSHLERELTPPKPIYLEGALPPQCELLVTDSETQAENSEDDNEAPVVLSGKMTLSLISHDQIQAETEDESLDEDENSKSTEETAAVVAADHRSSENTEKLMEKSDTAKSSEQSEEESESEGAEDEDEDDDDDEEEEDESEEEIDLSEPVLSEESEEEESNKKQTAVQEHAKNLVKNVATINTDDTDEDSEEEGDDDDDDDEDDDGDDDDEVVEVEVETVDDTNDEESLEESGEEEGSDESDASEEEEPKPKS